MLPVPALYRRVLLDLLRMNVAPLAVFQVLKSMCAGQRLPPGPEGGPAATMPISADSRGTSGAGGGGAGPFPAVFPRRAFPRCVPGQSPRGWPEPASPSERGPARPIPAPRLA